MKHNIQKLLVRAAILLVLALGSFLSIYAMDSVQSTGFESAGFGAAVQQDAPVFLIQVESLTETGASCKDIKPFTATGDGPVAPRYICADANNGRPVFTWYNDPNAEWYNLWFGVLGANFYQAHFEWYSVEANNFNLPRATCAGLTCTVTPPIELLQGGEFEVWMQAWGNGSFSDGGSGASIGAPAWNGPQTFSVPTSAPSAITGFTYTLTSTNANGNVSLGWAHSEGSTWYNVWLGTAPTEWSPRYYGWIDSVSLGCHDDDVCWLTPGMSTFSPVLDPLEFDVTLAEDEYIFYVQSWGHGLFNTGGIEGTSWVASPEFTVD